MSVLDLDRQKKAAARLLDAVGALADECEVHVDGTSESFVRFADVGPTQCADRECESLSFRVRKQGATGWREAGATVGSLDPADWRPALSRALELLEHSPEDPQALALPEPAAIAEVTHAVATESHGIAGKVAWVDAALRAAEAARLQPAGLTQTSVHASTVANSRGLLARGSTAKGSFSLTVSGPDASGIGQCTASDVRELDVEASIRRSIAKGQLAKNPTVFQPCETTVVLEPLAVSAILLFAAYAGFGSREVEEGTSFMAGRSGNALFSPSLSIYDDAQHPLLGALPFDGEGVARVRTGLVEAGVLGHPVTDRAHAQRMGLACTGHSPRRPSSNGPMAESLVVAPGTSSTEDLIRDVEDGLLVTQFHYTNLIDPRELALTGMTRNGTFRIRNGELVGGVKNLRFTQSLTEALGRIRGIGRDPELVGALFDGHLVTPALALDGFRFTSTTDF